MNQNTFNKDHYYEFDNITLTNKCKIDSCSKVFKGNVISNLKRHIKNCHRSVAISLNLDNNNDFQEQAPSESKKQKLEYNKTTITQACVGLCSKRSLPFKFFDYPELKFLLDPLFLKNKLNITAKNIINNINDAAFQIRNMIKKEVKNKIISLKVDSASRFNRSILGINCQYLINGVVKVRTLGMIELLKSHTAENLCTEILQILKLYDIEIPQIFTITTDNGANMVKAAILLVKEQEKFITENEIVCHDPSNNDENVDTDEIITVDENNSTITNENNSSETQTAENIETLVQNALELVHPILIPLRCAAHTFQLAIHDVLKQDIFKTKIDIIRAAVKQLKTTKYKQIFSIAKIKRPSIDVVTRWGSTFEMVDSFVQNKATYREIETNLNISDVEWEFCDTFLVALKPLHILTKKLQEEDMVMGDLFKYYIEFKIQLEKLPVENIFKNKLLSACEKRTEKLFENIGFACGLFIDPRFNYRNSTFFPANKIESTMVWFFKNIFN